ncbi:hypothetical protein HK414_22520 [Ramlibacter terrae]|uniref:Uncharacterized protein n=1 Tax=Ramlibacter terrae TaxID=2732511 RepID=A0ABX6P4X7_9BURK|nr:hypothetical protein HK414_22520 [Ramlibacter terrae]
MSKALGWLGVVLTVAYLTGWGLLVHHRANSFSGMELNAIGDFLGGSFGPLAFLWLVLGFFQQGIELRQNSAALRQQAEEVKAAAAHASGLLEVAKKEHQLELQKLQRAMDSERVALEAETMARAAAAAERERRAEAQRVRKLQPDFTFGSALRIEDRCTVRMVNDGQSCLDVDVQINESVSFWLDPVRVDHFRSKQTELLVFQMGSHQPDASRMQVNYTDREGNEYTIHLVAGSTGEMMVIEEDPEPPEQT